MAGPVGSLTPLVPVKTGISAERPVAPTENRQENQASLGWQPDSGFMASAAAVATPPGQAGGAEAVKPKAKASLVPIMPKDFRSLAPEPMGAAPGGRPEPARREPDDIQIQIGRIEVVAAPPRRAFAPKARRETSSLGEYLRRRDGKTV